MPSNDVRTPWRFEYGEIYDADDRRIALPSRKREPKLSPVQHDDNGHRIAQAVTLISQIAAFTFSEIDGSDSEDAMNGLIRRARAIMEQNR